MEAAKSSNYLLKG